MASRPFFPRYMRKGKLVSKIVVGLRVGSRKMLCTACWNRVIITYIFSTIAWWNKVKPAQRNFLQPYGFEDKEQLGTQLLEMMGITVTEDIIMSRETPRTETCDDGQNSRFSSSWWVYRAKKWIMTNMVNKIIGRQNWGKRQIESGFVGEFLIVCRKQHSKQV